MIGLLFLCTAAIWIGASIWIARLTGPLVPKPLRTATKVVVLAVLLALPFVDEAIGEYQFEKLCEINGIKSADLSKARGKRVKVAFGEREPVEGTILPIRKSKVLYTDATNGDVVIHHTNYYATGGWLMRHTWFSQGSSGPMLFAGNGCGFAFEDRLLRTASVSIIN